MPGGVGGGGGGNLRRQTLFFPLCGGSGERKGSSYSRYSVTISKQLQKSCGVFHEFVYKVI